VLASLRRDQPLHVATKVRVMPTTDDDLRSLVVKSVRESLMRLRLPRVTLLQSHNSITFRRNDQPTSITPEDVLGPKGLLAGMEDVRSAGLVEHFGLTGIGDADALRTVIQSRRFATIQAPFHLLNPSALLATPQHLCDPDYGGFLRDASELGMGLFAIRVFAAGALLGAEPSTHTLQTQFFPLPLYRRDLVRAHCLEKSIGSAKFLRELALRYFLSQPEFGSAIIGFGAVAHVEEAARIAELNSLSESELGNVGELWNTLADKD
jgi:aryl-alcohol dehydrogenase-like predicted oxidoreductase